MNADDEAPDLSDDLARIRAARVARIRHSNRLRTAHQLARAVGVQRRNALKLTRVRRATERKGGAMCTCDHQDARPAHSKSMHFGTRCVGLDSYGLPCQCPGFELLEDPFAGDRP